jgi:hypothetical protein
MALAWAGKLPVPENGPPKRRSELIKDLVDLWNASFLLVRGIELVLYRGKERCSGQHIGVVDNHLPYLDDPRDCPSSTSEDDSENSDGSDYGGGRDSYGRSHGRHGLNDVFEAGRRRREVKIAARAEKRRRRHERNRKRREKYREKKYSLYLTCVTPGVTPGGGHMNPGMPGGYATSGGGGGYGRGGY